MGINYNPKIVTSGIVLCYDAANSRSYPKSGTVWTDLSKNKITGTLNGDATYSSNNLGYIQLGSNTGWISTSLVTNYNRLSLCCWVSNTGSSSGGIITKGDINVTEYGLGFGYSNPLLLFARHNSYANQLTMSWVGYNTGFHYICMTVGAVNSTLYVDGIQVGQVAATLTTNDLAFQIGKFGTNGTVYYLGGSINLPMIYNRELSSTEIKQNFNATRDRYGV
jgi:hypothetical protein